jgi:hypothetical protein
MIQDSSRARRLEGEDSMKSVRESVAYNSSRLTCFAALDSALFVRDVPASQTSQSTNGGIATNSASVSSDTEPDQVVCPPTAMFPAKAPFPNETPAVP